VGERERVGGSVCACACKRERGGGRERECVCVRAKVFKSVCLETKR